MRKWKMWAVDLGSDRIYVYPKRPEAYLRPFRVEVLEVRARRKPRRDK